MNIDSTSYQIHVYDPLNAHKLAAVIQIIESSTLSKHNDGSLLRATFKISYKVLESPYFEDDRTFSFVPSIERIGFQDYIFKFNSMAGNTIFLNLSENLNGHRIGTFLFCRIIEWVKKFDSYEIRVAPLILTSAQAYPNNIVRRSKFYENMGIKIIFSDSTYKEGKSCKTLKTSDLKINRNWMKNISCITFI